MDNNKLNAQLLRDTATVAGLLADKALYTPLEDDLGPLRDEHATNLAQARTLEAAVMDEDGTTATEQKPGPKPSLRPWLRAWPPPCKPTPPAKATKTRTWPAACATVPAPSKRPTMPPSPPPWPPC